MSILSEGNRIIALKNSIRSRLITLGIIQDQNADLEDCYTSLTTISSRTSSDIEIIAGEMHIPKGYYQNDLDIPTSEYIVAVPVLKGSLTYNTSAQVPLWDNYDTTKIEISGDTSGTNAGEYTAVFTLKDAGYVWAEDGSTGPKQVSWTINKAAGYINLSTSSISVKRAQSGTLSISRSHGGDITAWTTSSSIATISVSGATVVVSGVEIGSTTGYVLSAENINYTSASAYFSISVSYALITVSYGGDVFYFDNTVTGSTSIHDFCHGEHSSWTGGGTSGYDYYGKFSNPVRYYEGYNYCLYTYQRYTSSANYKYGASIGYCNGTGQSGVRGAWPLASLYYNGSPISDSWNVIYIQPNTAYYFTS